MWNRVCLNLKFYRFQMCVHLSCIGLWVLWGESLTRFMYSIKILDQNLCGPCTSALQCKPRISYAKFCSCSLRYITLIPSETESYSREEEKEKPKKTIALVYILTGQYCYFILGRFNNVHVKHINMLKDYTSLWKIISPYTLGSSVDLQSLILDCTFATIKPANFM